MRYVRIWTDEAGATHFEDVEPPSTEQVVADGVPPVLVTGPFPVSSIIVVEPRPGGPDWEPHVAPRRQWIVVSRGRGAIQVTDGERREFGPGELILVEDVTGEGHASNPLTEDFAFFMIPCAD